jgi:hypothetical protein
MGASTTHFVSLQIANLRVTLALAYSDLANSLHQRYAAFSPPPDSVPDRMLQGAVHLERPISQTAIHLTAQFSFEQGVLRFDNPGYTGWIDGSQGSADLTLASPAPAADIDYFMRTAFALLAFQGGGLLFHSAGIVRGDFAYLFFGHSGSGKTTVSRLAGEGIVLNDDLLLLMPEGEGWMVYGTPFSNPTQVAPDTHHKAARLGGLYRLVQARSVFRELAPPALALAEMVSNVPIIPADPARLPTLLERLQQVLEYTPAYYLHSLPDSSFWAVVEPPHGGANHS